MNLKVVDTFTPLPPLPQGSSGADRFIISSFNGRIYSQRSEDTKGHEGTWEGTQVPKITKGHKDRI
jgi:hypothetical protein